MIRNIQRPRNSPTLDLKAAHKDPIRMHSQAAAPRCGSSWKRRRVATRLEKLPRVDALLSRQRVEVSENNCGQGISVSLGGYHLQPGELPAAGGVGIRVRVEDSKRLRAN